MMENLKLKEKILKGIKRNRIMNNVMITVPITILTIILISALFANFIAPYPPNENNLTARLLPPAWTEEGTTAHLLGTDQLGRDIFSRVVHGSRISLGIAALVTLFTAIISTVIGISSGYFGGRFDQFMMRVTDMAMAFPALIIQLLLAATLGQSFRTLLIAFTVTSWAGITRTIRGLTLSYKSQDFIAQAYINGCSSIRIMFRHLLPNLINFIVIYCAVAIPGIIMGEAILSYLGIGFPPPTPSWGAIAQGGINYMPDFWWIAVFPCIAIALLVLSMFYFGNWLRDKLNPMLRQM